MVMRGGRADVESIGSITASFSRITDDATSREHPGMPLFPSFRSASRKSRWRIVKHVIVATLRFRSAIGRGLRPPLRSMLNLLPDWRLISMIAAYGRSGVLYEVMNRPTGHTRALMELPYDASQREEISREVDMLKELDHPNLVKCYDVVISADTGRIFLILEPLCRSFVGESITVESDLVNLAHQLILGLTYLHQNKIAHGDIKHSNVFFSHTRQIKLLYLGKTLSNTPPFLTEIGAMHDGFSWDIWSVGLCILKWSEGLNWSHRDVGFNQDIDNSKSVPALPQKHEPSLGLDLNSSEIDVNFSKDEVLPSSSNEGALVWNRELLRLLISCMQTDVLKRWTAEQLVHHPFFDQLQLKREVGSPLLMKLKREVGSPLLLRLIIL